MPPWGGVKGFGEFKNDISLSQEELTLIAEWVEGGAPEGDPNFLPTAPMVKPGAKPAVKQGLPVHANFSLNAAIAMEGIRPTAAAPNTQIIARKPDGTIEPLLWLYNYKSEWNQAFLFRTPIQLPKGTVIEMTSPMTIELLTAAPKPAR